MIDAKIGDYIEFFPIKKALQWTDITIYQIVDIIDDSFTGGGIEYIAEYYDGRCGIAKAVIPNTQTGLFILNYSEPSHKILIDRFKVAKMRSIIET